MTADAGVDPARLAAAFADVRSRLTGPGGPFEIIEEDVRGLRMEVYRNRDTSLRDLLVNSAAHGDREYLVDRDRRITYAQHLRQVASLAGELADRHGVRKGDRVAIFAGNTADWVISFWAAASLGAIAVAFNAWWTPREAAYALEHTSPRLVLADAKRAELLSSGNEPAVPVLRMETELPDLLRARPDAVLPQVDVDEDDPAVIMFTSGTTGYPKGALHSVRNLLAVVDYHRLNDAVAAALSAAPAAARRVLMSLPLFHIASLHNLAIPRLVAGDTVVIDGGRFDVDRVLAIIERERITNWAIVPTMAHRVTEHPDIGRYDLSSLTALSVNSAPSSPALKDRLRAAIPTVQSAIIDSYGLTESCTAATVATPLDLALHPTTVGRVVATVRLEVRDPEGKPVPEGETGEICLRSPMNMLGYWNDPAATAAVFAQDGWLRTGDLGYLQDGLLYMSTRRSDLILRGGENVYPAEIEAVLDEHPLVAECAVFGVTHADLGEEVAAVVVASSPTELPGEDELRAFVSERLAYYKVPTRWRITTSPLPRTATGKVVRTAVSL